VKEREKDPSEEGKIFPRAMAKKARSKYKLSIFYTPLVVKTYFSQEISPCSYGRKESPRGLS
jgi:hypothetical protein